MRREYGCYAMTIATVMLSESIEGLQHHVETPSLSPLGYLIYLRIAAAHSQSFAHPPAISPASYPFILPLNTHPSHHSAPQPPSSSHHSHPFPPQPSHPVPQPHPT